MLKRSHLICGYELGKHFTTLIQHAVIIRRHQKDVKGEKSFLFVHSDNQ